MPRKAHTPWFRFEANYPTNPKTLRMTWEGVALFPLICCMFKAQGWDGEADAADVDPAVLARYTGMPIDVASTGLAECFRVGYMDGDGTDTITIPAWRSYQPDPTAAERAKRHRKKQTVTPGNGDEPLSTVTPVTNGDGTGRTGRDAQDARARAGFVQPPKHRGMDASGDPLVLRIWEHWLSRSKHPAEPPGRQTAADISDGIADLPDPRDVSPILHAIDLCFRDEWCLSEKGTTDINYIIKYRETLVRRAKTPRKPKKHVPTSRAV